MRRPAVAARWLVLAWACIAGGCASPSAPLHPGVDPPTKGFPGAPGVLDSVYVPLDRATRAPSGYGLYTVLLARSADAASTRLLAELLNSTVGAAEAALPREQLNLITLPVKNTAEARRALAAARGQPEATASALLQKSYDFGQAALWLASVCRADRGADVAKVCGSTVPAGPLLVTTLRPLEGAATPSQPMLIVNLSGTPPEALREVLAAYRRQIQRGDNFADRSELDSWRLRALNVVLDAARFLPLISKAYAASRP
jgi:hypothetical protein